ncbi:variable large family protein (plasmid) [Borrelia miyamotoi]|uniref:Variable large protein n=2 Tax=Borrelia miyamotoi TaxID=47466 RepID=A0AAQ3CPU1_9SPIR|nr:variable large family protein [Borrelia miyamotoi]AHH05970.1 Variable outer membrane protein [Borrelia miyamotoi FR64b]ATQ15513.1 variable large family protein [Borrelia miyamotoi]ATQ17911.1 variable large family protein [Borrelia miyamotoi]ATQ19138.1 variable large family protein [Borrelia miyamotoi]ATQ20202.1 variable large family protein [Borrelia miyamotoi]
MKKRKTLSAIIMTLFLIIGCNNGGGEDPQKVFLTSIANLGKGFLDVFVTFGDMITGAFGIKAETKKSDVGKYFTDIEKTMTSVKEKLQAEVAANGNYEKVKTVVDQFITETLDKIAAGAKEAAKGATGEAIGNATSAGHGASPADKDSVISLVKGIKTIVGVVLKDNEGNAGATKTGDDKKSIGNLFADNAGKTDAKEENIAKASASIGAVSGADILQAIAQSKENPAVDSTDGIEKAKDAADIAIAPAVANKKEIKEDSAKKDAIIAAGIALRAMAKGGKFAANNNAKDADAVNGVAASAVGKTLSTLIIAVRNTVDSGLKTINAALATIKQEDKSAEVTNTAEVTASVQK